MLNGSISPRFCLKKSALTLPNLKVTKSVWQHWYSLIIPSPLLFSIFFLVFSSSWIFFPLSTLSFPTCVRCGGRERERVRFHVCYFPFFFRNEDPIKKKAKFFSVLFLFSQRVFSWINEVWKLQHLLAPAPLHSNHEKFCCFFYPFTVLKGSNVEIECLMKLESRWVLNVESIAYMHWLYFVLSLYWNNVGQKMERLEIQIERWVGR